MSQQDGPVPGLMFVGYCSHVDRMREYSAREGLFREVREAADADLICIAERDPATHLALARSHLEAGRRVFVDKPLAATMQDAREMAQTGLVTSFSSLRWGSGLDHVRGAGAVRITGPARAADPGGAIFYAVHAVELAQEILGGDATVRDIRPVDGVIEVDCGFGAGTAHLELTAGRDDWRIEAAFPDGSSRSLIVSPREGYYEAAARRIVDFALGEPAPVGERDMLSTMRVVEAIRLAETGFRESGTRTSGAW